MDIGAAAFWISTAAVMIAVGWFASRSEAEKHETLRRLIEKTGTVDEEKWKELFNPQSLPGHLRSPGEGYRMLRVTGTIVMFGAVGLAVFFLLIDMPSTVSGMAIAAGVALFGAGLFFSSRFATPPARPTEQSPSER
jgi:hypothetical protein